MFRSVFLLILTLLATTLGCGAGNTDADYLEKAQKLLADNRQDAAMIELKNALTQNNDNLEANWSLGQILYRQGNYEESTKWLLRAQELGKAANDVTPLLAEALLRSGDLESVTQLHLPDSLSGQAYAEVLAAKAIALLGNGELRQANALTARAIETDPASPFALEANLRILFSQFAGDWSDVRQQLTEIFALAPDYWPAWSILGDVERHSGNLEAAEQAYSRAIESQPSQFENYFKRALILVELGRLDDAKRDLDFLNKNAAQSVGTRYLQGIEAFERGNIKDAITAFEAVEPHGEKFPQALLYLAFAHRREGNLAQAEHYAQRFVVEQPDSDEGRKVLAGIKLNTGRVEAVADLVQPILDRNPGDVEATNLMATALLLQGKSDQGLELLAGLSKIHPESAAARLGLGAALIASGDSELGYDHLRAALEMDPDLKQADVLTIRLHLQQGELEEALQAAEAFQAKAPDNLVANSLLAGVYLANGKEQNASKIYTRMLELDSASIAAKEGLAYLAIRNKDFRSAREYYQDILASSSDHLPALIRLAYLDEREGKFRSMVSLLRKAQNAHPEKLSPRLKLADYYLANGELGLVDEVLQGLSADQLRRPAVLYALALVKHDQQEYREARRLLTELIAVQPNAALPYFYLGSTLKNLGEPDAARKEFAKAVELAPGFIQARMELTKLLLGANETVAASAQLEALQKLAPNNPERLLLQAYLARLDGKSSDALRFTEQAFAQDSTARHMLLVAEQLSLLGRDAQANMLQEQWLRDHPEDFAVRIQLASVYVDQGLESDAIKHYRECLRLQPDSMPVLNNLAWLIRKSNPEQAIEYAKKATAVAPDSADALDTLAVILLEQGEAKKAKTAIDNALQRSENNPTIRFHAAKIDVALGETASAMRTLQAMTGAENDEFPEQQEAAELLRQLQKKI